VFERVARTAAKAMGSAAAFVAALSVVVLWAVSGPLFGFSQTWQLVINTSTTIVTFLMVFLLQSSQNRDTIAVHQKLDELIEATKAAHDDVVGLEDAPPEVVERVKRDHVKRRQSEEQGAAVGGEPELP
jgi:low affinity Fe/Cu permease